MAPSRGWFEIYKSIDRGLALLGNNKGCKVTSIGSIRIKMFDKVEKILKEVRYVPKLKRNLISLVILDLKGNIYNMSQ